MHIEAYISLNLRGILRKIEGVMRNNVAKILMICCHAYQIHHQCYGSEFFSDLNMVLKVNCFEGFANRSDIYGLVTNNTSERNHRDYNSIATFTYQHTLIEHSDYPR